MPSQYGMFMQVLDAIWEISVEGITCSDWAVVDTGAPSSAVPSAGELRFKSIEAFRCNSMVLQDVN